MQIYLFIHEILANKAFTVTDDLISWLFVVAFIYPAFVVDSPHLEIFSAA